MGAESLSPAPVCGAASLGLGALVAEALASVEKPQGYAWASPLSGVGRERTGGGFKSWLCGPPRHLKPSALAFQTSYNCGMPLSVQGEHPAWILLAGRLCLASVLLALGRRLQQAFPGCGELRPLSVAVRGLLIIVAPRVVGHGLNSCGA